VLQQSLRRFEQARIITRMRDHSEDILVVVEEKRVNLEYYKNTLLHFVAPVSMLCMAVRALREHSPLPEAELLTQFRALSLMLRGEFILDPDQSTEEHYQRAMEELLLYGALQRGPEGLRVLDPRRVTELGELIRNFLECYDLCLRGLRALEERRAPAAELPRLILDFGRGLLAVGELQRSEALSLPALQSALQILQEEGLVQAQGASLRVDEGAGEARLMMLRRMMD
jgi:glycerol-3-phosphate O-acyltransferase